MRLRLAQEGTHKHTSMVTAVGWSKNANKQYELFSCSDDKTIQKWHIEGSNEGQISTIDAYCTNMHWVPGGKGQSDTFSLACTDGTFRLIARAGREEKKVDAHRGAVICCRWNYDGSALATAGEDGALKIWSRSGMLRSTIAQLSHAIYSVAWSPDGEHILFASEKKICFKSIQAGQKQTEWKAHDGVVLQVDWSPVTNLILSGGEDCKYKIWDSYGRLQFTSAPLEHVVTAVAWSPNGRYFAVGAYNTIKLCDKTGWSYCRESPISGSIFSISWTEDGTQLAAGGGNGAVIFASLVNRTITWQYTDVTLQENNVIRIRDVANDATEELDFRDRVIDMSIGFGALVVTTNSQCHVHNSQNWATPHVEDLKEPPTLIVQSPFHFALVDSVGVHVYTYEGRLMSSIKSAGLRLEFLNHHTLTLCRDAVAMVDSANPKQVRLFDSASGRPMGDALEHKLEILTIALNLHGTGPDRKVAIMDKNRDLYLCLAHRGVFEKMASMVDAFVWNDATDMLCALADEKLMCWFYPGAAFVDKDLLPGLCYTRNAKDCGKSPYFVSFHGAHCTIRRADGANVQMVVPHFPLLLYQHFEKGHWEKAMRLCRYVKSPELWSCLAAMALHSRELVTAETALAAIDEVDKVHFISHINKLPDEVLKSAELALFCKRPEEAIGILLQNKRLYRAIKMYIRMHKWEPALDLAVQHKTHVDTVLAYRERHLAQMKHEENNPKFKRLGAEIPHDWDTVKAKIDEEKQNEKRRMVE